MQAKPKLNKVSKDLAKSKVQSKLSERFQEEISKKEKRMKDLREKYQKIEDEKLKRDLKF